MASKTDVRYIVRFTLDTYPDTYSVRLEACYMGTDAYGSDPDRIIVRNPLWSDYGSDPVTELDSFAITSRVSRTGGDGAEWYGYRAEYVQPYSVNIGRARAMVKLMTKVERAVTAHRDRFGYSLTFPAFASVVARATGATETRCFGIRDASYADGYRWTDAEGLRYIMRDVAAGERDDLTASRY
jgi:hypothetical protein